MKQFRSKQWASISMLFLGVLAVVTSCKKENNEPVNDGEEASSAWILGYRTETPQGEIYYIEAHENVPSQTNSGNAVELGLNSRIYSYGSHAYTWNGDAATITKWEADRSTLELSPVGIISFASIGVSGNIAEPAFVSENQAFTTRLSEGIVVEWNPSTMEITEVYDVDPFPELGGNSDLLFEFSKKITADGKIIIPIETAAPSACCAYPEGVAGARSATLDPATGNVTYQVDDRLLASDVNFYTDIVTGTNFVGPTYNNSFISPYFDNAEELPSPYTLLKVNNDGTFDSSFEYDLSEVVDIHFYSSTSFVYDNKIVLNYLDTSYTWSEIYDARWYVFAEDTYKAVVVDLATDEVKPFTALAGYDYGVPLKAIDNQSYIRAGYRDPNGRVDEILRQDAIDQFSVVTTHKGGIFQHYSKLW